VHLALDHGAHLRQFLAHGAQLLVVGRRHRGRHRGQGRGRTGGRGRRFRGGRRRRGGGTGRGGRMRHDHLRRQHRDRARGRGGQGRGHGGGEVVRGRGRGGGRRRGRGRGRRFTGALGLDQGPLHRVLVVVAGRDDLHPFLGAAVGEDHGIRSVLGADHPQRGTHVGGNETLDFHG